MSVFVKPGNAVEHNGVRYEAGEEVKDCGDKEAQALLDAGVVSEGQAESAPSPEEVAATAEEAGAPSDAKKGLFR